MSQYVQYVCMYTYIGTCDNTTDFPVDLSMTFLALGLLHIKSIMAGVYLISSIVPSIYCEWAIVYLSSVIHFYGKNRSCSSVMLSDPRMSP